MTVTDKELEELFFDPEADTLDLGLNPSDVEVEEAPSDNVGRDTCFWCNRPTIQKALFNLTYSYCQWCKK